MTNAEVREIAGVLKSNNSLLKIVVDWENLSAENKVIFLQSRHKAIINCKEYLLQDCNNGNLEVVQAFIENKTTIKLNEPGDDGKSAMYLLGYAHEANRNGDDNSNNNNNKNLESTWVDECFHFVDILASHFIDEGEFKLGRLDVKYGTPALVKGCESGKLTLKDAKVLVEESEQDPSEKKDGNSLVYVMAYNNGGDDVLTYLISKGGGTEGEMQLGRFDGLKKK